MKKYLLLLIIMFFIFTKSSFADSKCSYTEQAELLNKAANVKTSYEIATEKVSFIDGDATVDYFKIQIYNVTEEFKISIKNDYDNSTKSFSYSDSKDGVITYKWNNADKVTNCTMEVYASGKTNCSGEKFKTLYLQIPRFNEYYDRKVCETLTDFYLCQKYITSNLVTEERFFEQLDSYQKGKINNNGEEIDNRNIFDKAFDFIKDNKWYFLGGIVLISGTGIYFYAKKSKKRRELGL